MYLAKKQGRFRHWKLVADSVNMVIGLITIGLALFIFFNIETRIMLLPIMFMLAAIMNLLGGIKAIYYGRRLSGLGQIIVSVIICGFAILSFLTMWI
jgi:hypothetical protein